MILFNGATINLKKNRMLLASRSLATVVIDYENAFDRVQHVKLMDILHRIDVGKKEVWCIQNFRKPMLELINTKPQTI